MVFTTSVPGVPNYRTSRVDGRRTSSTGQVKQLSEVCPSKLYAWVQALTVISGHYAHETAQLSPGVRGRVPRFRCEEACPGSTPRQEYVASLRDCARPGCQLGQSIEVAARKVVSDGGRIVVAMRNSSQEAWRIVEEYLRDDQ